MASRAEHSIGDFSIGEVIGRTAALFGANPVVMLGLPAIMTIALIALMAVMVLGFGVALFGLGPSALTQGQSIEAIMGIIAVVGAAVFVAAIIGLVLHGALVATGAAALDGERLSLGAALARGLNAAPRLFLLVLILIVTLGGGFGLVAVATGVGVGVAATGGNGGAAFGLVAILWIGMIVLGLWLAAVLAGVSGASVVERRGPFGAISRSAALTRGQRLRIIGLMLVMVALSIGVSIALALVQALLLGFNSFGPGANPFVPGAGSAGMVAIAVNTLISLVVQTLLNAYGAALQGSLFAALRQGREGLAQDRLSEVFA